MEIQIASVDDLFEAYFANEIRLSYIKYNFLAAQRQKRIDILYSQVHFKFLCLFVIELDFSFRSVNQVYMLFSSRSNKFSVFISDIGPNEK